MDLLSHNANAPFQDPTVILKEHHQVAVRPRISCEVLPPTR